MTDLRAEFCAVVSTGSLLKSDAIVVLCGEDAEPRLLAGLQLMATGGALQIMLSGGVSDPPRKLSAGDCAPIIVERGVAWDRVIIDDDSENTYEQAMHVSDKAVELDWKRILLVASPYHSFRAFLTMVNALKDDGIDRTCEIVNVPAGQTKWFAAPAGLDEPRFLLLDREFDKIERYQAKGDVASYEEGLAYLHYWESRR